MGVEFLLDSNVIIDLHGNFRLSDSLIQLLTTGRLFVSDISKIEVLGFSLSEEDEIKFRTFFNRVDLVEIDRSIVERSISVRKQKKIKLGDAIIAATALQHNLKLVTRNIRDFKGIGNLDLVDSGQS
jgi:predicted nucleic acid-binding protein